MKLCQPRLAVQGLGGHAQAFEVVENVGLNALQTGLGGLEAVGVDAESQVLGLDKAVVAPRQLVNMFHPRIVEGMDQHAQIDVLKITALHELHLAAEKFNLAFGAQLFAVTHFDQLLRRHRQGGHQRAAGPGQEGGPDQGPLLPSLPQ